MIGEVTAASSYLASKVVIDTVGQLLHEQGSVYVNSVLRRPRQLQCSTIPQRTDRLLKQRLFHSYGNKKSILSSVPEGRMR